MQFLSEKRLNGRHIFGRFVFLNPNLNRISIFHTSLINMQEHNTMRQKGRNISNIGPL